MPDKPAGPVDENRAYAILPQREARGRIREGVLCCAAAVSLHARHKHAPTTRRIGRRGSAADRDSTAPEKHAPAKRERRERRREQERENVAPCTLPRDNSAERAGQMRPFLASPVWPCFFWDNVMGSVLCAAVCGCRVPVSCLCARLPAIPANQARARTD